MNTVVACAAIVLVCAVAFAQENVKSWNFDADEAGKAAKGFSGQTGKWEVRKDDSAPSKPNVLAQTAAREKKEYNVVLATDTSCRDLELSVKFKSVEGKIDQGGGLVWRAKDAKNYYTARFNPLEDNYRLYKVVDGVRTQLQSADLKLPAGWHTLKVVMAGDQITCYCNDQKLLEAKDDTFQDAGKIGLWTKADAQTLFDDLSLTVRDK
jgi:hypothetical protein